MSLAELNTLTADAATTAFMRCCSCRRWAAQMVEGRPYASADALRERADRCWSQLNESDYLEAFDAHPKIGDPDSLAKKYADTARLAASEQGAVVLANDDTLKALALANARYLKRFGFIFIVCASGKSAAQMLALLEARIDNERGTELANAREEQRKIFQLRLEKLL